MEEYLLGLTKIEDLIRELYRTISFSNDNQINLDRFKKLFKPEARLVYFSGEKIDHMKLEPFVIKLREQIENGSIPSFYEYEIHRHIDRFGKIAHVFSTYETKANPESVKVLQRGINSMQLIFDNGRWWIVNLMWFDESDRYSIPEQFLPPLSQAGNSK